MAERSGHGVGEPGTPTYLAHWDGHRLTAVPAPAADGSGGLWLATGDRYLHLHGGHWSSCPAPTGQGQALQAGGLTPVPGTGTVWAVASTSGSEEGIPDQAFIQRYDP